jgi:hypothetical protein
MDFLRLGCSIIAVHMVAGRPLSFDQRMVHCSYARLPAADLPESREARARPRQTFR